MFFYKEYTFVYKITIVYTCKQKDYRKNANEFTSKQTCVHVMYRRVRECKHVNDIVCSKGLIDNYIQINYY